MSNQGATAELHQLPAELSGRRPSEIRVVTDPIPVLDTARFEHMQRIAIVMAKSNLIPDSLCLTGKGNEKVELPAERIVANCFLIVNQAVRWSMDPFAVAQCVSVVHGKLCYEGKLISAIIEEKLGIRLKYKWNDGKGDALGIVVSGKFPDEDEPRTVEGTVGEWKTTGTGSPWTGAQQKKMLAYRGAREWCRLHAPGLMLGVYSDDELEALSDDARASRATNITPPAPPAPPRKAIPHDPNTGEIWDDEENKPSAGEPVPSAPPPPPPRQQPSPQVSQPSARTEPAADKPATAPDKSAVGSGAGAGDAGEIPDFLDRRPKKPPQPDENPEAFIKYVGERFAEAPDIDALSEAWERLIDPVKDRIFPPDMEELAGLYRRRERELEP